MSLKSLFRLAVLLANLFAAMQATGAEPRQTQAQRAELREPYIQSTSRIVGVFPPTIGVARKHLIDGGTDHNGHRFTLKEIEHLSFDDLIGLHSDVHADTVDYALLSRIAGFQVVKYGSRPAVSVQSSLIQKITSSPPAETSKLRLATLLIRDRSRSSWGGSAVCVSATGVVFTAKHITLGDNVIVAFPSLGERPAIRIHEQPETEGVRAFKITTPGEYPFVPVATAKSQQGDRVTYAGYPGGRGLDTYLEGTGTITGGQPGAVAGGGYNIVRNLGGPGMSGGPMVNARGELVGLCHGGDQSAQYSQWIGSTAVIQAWSAITQPPRLQASAGPQTQPRLIAFSMAGCAGCKQFEADLSNRNIRELDEIRGNVLIVKQTDGVWSHPEIVASYERTTGQRLNSVPLFWVEGTKHYSAETYSLSGFCRWLKNIIRAIFGMPPIVVVKPPVVVTPPPAVVVTPPVQQEGGGPILGAGVQLGPVGAGVSIGGEVPPPVEVIAEPDWGYVRIIGVAKKFLGDGARGVAVKLAIEQGRGRILDRINRLMDGKAHLDIVTERIEPETFLAVKTAARIEPNPVSVIVLVRKLTDGLVRGVIERRVSAVIDGHVPEGLPIRIVFESSQPELFAAIQAALLTVEPSPTAAVLPAEIDLGPVAVAPSVQAEVALADGIVGGSLELPSVGLAGVEPSPQVAAEPDWRAVQIYVVVRKVLTGAKGIAAGIALRKAIGPVRRKIDSIFEGKSFKPELDLIAERLEPERFAAVVAAADIDPQPVSIVVLVGKTFSGVKGLVAGKVAAILTGHVPKGIPVDLVLERVNPDDYRRIGDAAHGVLPVIPVPVPPVEPPAVDVIPDTTERLEPLFETEVSDQGLLDDVRQAAAAGSADTFQAVDKILKQREAELAKNLKAEMKAVANEAIQQAKAKDSGVENKIQMGTDVTILGIVGELLRRRWIRDRAEKRQAVSVAEHNQAPPTTVA